MSRMFCCRCALLIFLLSSYKLIAQDFQKTAIQFKPYSIGSSGCAASFPEPPGDINVQTGDDGSTLYLARTQSNNFYFSLAIQKLSSAMGRGRTEHGIFLQQYLEGLKQEWKILEAQGRKINQLGEKDLQYSGISEFWRDEKGMLFAIQAWANPNFYVVMSVHGRTEVPDEKIRNAFFYSFLFPEMIRPVQEAGIKRKRNR